MNPQQPSRQAFASLRQLVRPRRQVEHCDLCSTELPSEHEHLIEPASRRLSCACTACALLFSSQDNGRFRRVPRDLWFLPEFRLTEAQWNDLHLPINLAFFFHSSPAGRVIAVYPSPAGPTESLLPLEAWHELEVENPILRELQPDVEALLVNRVTTPPEHYRVPIDECYRLVGLIRSSWRGLSGGTEVWKEIASYFSGLKDRSCHTRVTSHG